MLSTFEEYSVRCSGFGFGSISRHVRSSMSVGPKEVSESLATAMHQNTKDEETIFILLGIGL